ncbi:MAG: hypothetical protein ABSH03_06145 [Candidatus Lustribacter sp.]|jgi:hypothetical protein
MTLTGSATLIDVAFAVCTALDRVGTIGVLTGGSAATFYVPDRYQSLDVDFVLRVVPQRHVVDEAMRSLGFSALPSGIYGHPDLAVTVEFPRGPMAIGRDIIRTWSTQRRGDELLHINTVTDCVRDRFMHFWAWNDRSALDAALAVAGRHHEDFDRTAFRSWVEAERAYDSSYPQDKVDEFFRRLQHA